MLITRVDYYHLKGSTGADNKSRENSTSTIQIDYLTPMNSDANITSTIHIS